ncbi:MAG TPA: hypothetical protein VGP55_10035 [Chitinophagaceae bacterium]|nr:hypothetical protein [Chitinophagaceae bacterium]
MEQRDFVGQRPTKAANLLNTLCPHFTTIIFKPDAGSFSVGIFSNLRSKGKVGRKKIMLGKKVDGIKLPAFVGR